MRKKFKNFILSLFCIALFAVSTASTFIPAYSSGPATVEDGTSSGGTDVIANGVNALNTATGKVTVIAMALFPLSVIMLCVVLLVTHDPKKVAGLLWVLAIICVTTLIIILTNNGTTLELIKQLAGFFTTG